MEHGPCGPEPGEGLGIRTVKLLASYPGVFVSHPGQGVEHKARGKMDAELSVLGWLHPQLVLLSIILHSYTGGCNFPAQKPSGLPLP